MTNTDTINATTVPTRRISASPPVIAIPASIYLAAFKRLAPNITGTARKNVNSAAVALDTPIINAPTIVAPERDVPGKTAAASWNNPIITASLYVMASILVVVGLFFPPDRFYNDKNNAYHNQCNCNRNRMIKQFINQIIK